MAASAVSTVTGTVAASAIARVEDASDESSDRETHLGKPCVGEEAQHFQGTEFFDEIENGELVSEDGSENARIQRVNAT